MYFNQDLWQKKFFEKMKNERALHSECVVTSCFFVYSALIFNLILLTHLKQQRKSIYEEGKLARSSLNWDASVCLYCSARITLCVSIPWNFGVDIWICVVWRFRWSYKNFWWHMIWQRGTSNISRREDEIVELGSRKKKSKNVPVNSPHKNIRRQKSHRPGQ